MMHVEFEGTYACTAHTGFVDDVMTSVATYEVSQVPDMSIELSDALDQAFIPHGMQQNKEKA
eukprot:1804927-Karenia_brevis.AAC.1